MLRMLGGLDARWKVISLTGCFGYVQNRCDGWERRVGHRAASGWVCESSCTLLARVTDYNGGQLSSGMAMMWDRGRRFEEAVSQRQHAFVILHGTRRALV